MKATLTSKGQITIPVEVRKKLRLAPGDVLEFDENAPFLKAIKAINPEAWAKFGENWKDPFPELPTGALIDQLRGPVDLPKL